VFSFSIDFSASHPRHEHQHKFSLVFLILSPELPSFPHLQYQRNHLWWFVSFFFEVSESERDLLSAEGIIGEKIFKGRRSPPEKSAKTSSDSRVDLCPSSTWKPNQRYIDKIKKRDRDCRTFWVFLSNLVSCPQFKADYLPSLYIHSLFSSESSQICLSLSMESLCLLHSFFLISIIDSFDFQLFLSDKVSSGSL
jgi:hypothetical protein